MSKDSITEVKKGQTGTGLLIENDGYITLNDSRNQTLRETLEPVGGKRNIPSPFVVSAVFQKYGLENANGRIYPEHILKREVEKYQQAIKERRAYGECYRGTAEVLTSEGWKKISSLKINDKVKTLDTETGVESFQEVARITSHEAEENLYILLVGKNGKNEIAAVVTANHKFPLFDENGFVGIQTASELSENPLCPGCLRDIDGNLLEITSVSTILYKGYVYCLEAKNHTFLAREGEGSPEIWTHNCNHPDGSMIDLGRLAMNIVELHWEGHTLVGKLEIPITDGFRNFGFISCFADQMAHWLISGLRIGVSSRGLGSVSQEFGKLIVGDDFELTCWDFVSQPSTPGAWVDINPENLQQFVESKTPVKETLKEDRFSKFDDWLND